LTLDELLALLDREIVRTWGSGEAAAAAPAAAPPDVAAVGERCLLVSVGGRRFAVPACAVQAVSELPPVAAVPFSPPWLRGLARVAGGAVAVVDLARLLALAAAGAPAAAPAAAPGDDQAVRETLLVVRTSDASLDGGLAVRGIARLVALPGMPGRPPAPGELDGCRSALVAGLLPDPHDPHRPPVAVLDIDRLLRDARQELCA
jgi:chemotaxis signal transduction protein